MGDSERSTLAWRKSEASGAGDCVEVALDHDLVLVRSSKDGAGPVLSFSRSEWTAFLVGVRNGTFDLT